MIQGNGVEAPGSIYGLTSAVLRSQMNNEVKKVSVLSQGGFNSMIETCPNTNSTLEHEFVSPSFA